MAITMIRLDTATLMTLSLLLVSPAQLEETDNLGDIDFSEFFAEENLDDTGHLEKHIKEDVGIDINVANMTEEEREWYYFKLHDTDDDYRLDGLEMIKAWAHHYQEHTPPADSTRKTDQELKKQAEEEQKMFEDLVDEILKQQDANNDGYLDYFEYVLAKEKAKRESQEKEEKQKQKE